jgi:hypothetical protein
MPLVGSGAAGGGHDDFGHEPSDPAAETLAISTTPGSPDGLAARGDWPALFRGIETGGRSVASAGELAATAGASGSGGVARGGGAAAVSAGADELWDATVGSNSFVIQSAAICAWEIAAAATRRPTPRE